MLISCTKKLADALKIEVIDVVPIKREPLYEWHANLFVFNRRKGVILMNNKTRFSVVLYGLTAEHFHQFKTIALSAIEQTFRAEGFTDDIILNYVRTSSQVIYAKSSDRSILGQINDVLYMMQYMEDYLPADDIYMIELSKQMSRTPMGKHVKYVYPIDVLKEELNKLG